MNIRSIKKKINSGLLTPNDLTIFFTKKQKHKDKNNNLLSFYLCAKERKPDASKRGK
jgi:hypothetical protein